VVKLLRDRFVCIAVDNVNHPQLTPGERAFVLDRGLKGCTWGMSVFKAGGKVLEMGGSFEAQGVVPMLQRTLEKFTPEDNLDIPQPAPEELARLKQPPEGGLVCYVTWQVLGDYRAEGSPTTGDELYAGLYQRSLGVDRLWVRRDEAEALARGEFPESLKRRLMPHIDYVVAGDVAKLELTASNDRLRGSFRTSAGDDGDLAGFVETSDGRVTRFDLLVKGLAEQLIDCGFSASLHVIPKGKKLPVAVLFTLADPADELSRVVPLRANDENYLK
jgi:hypothetical protein